MKKGIIILLLAVLCLLNGCTDRDTKRGISSSTIQVARSTYYYDQGYVQAEGWKYDMTLSAVAQVEQLNQLVDAVQMELRMDGEEFLLGQGYRLTWRDASGNVTKEMLVLSPESISMQGMLFSVEGAQPLVDWLDELRLDEQDVAN